MDEGIDRRLLELERRLLVLEQRLGAAGPPTAPNFPGATDAPAPTDTRTHEADIPLARAVPPPLSRPMVHTAVPAGAVVIPPYPNPPAVTPKSAPVPDRLESDRPVPDRLESDRSMSDHWTPPPLPGSSAPPPAMVTVARAPAAPVNLEQTIGLKWAGWIGAIVLVIGAGLGFKFAYDQGWLGNLPPMVKLLVMTLIGFGLIGLGEYVFRRVDRIASAGLYGAGVAVLFLGGYASHAWYGIVNPTGALALMGAAGLIGMAVAARSDLVAVAVIAILGANVAPLVLGGKVDDPAPFLAYLTSLQFMALGLCAWRAAPKWWSLRTLTLITTCLWMTATCVTLPNGAHRATLLAFACLFWIAFQLELLFTLPRAARSGQWSLWQRSAGATFSFCTTAAFAFWILIIYDHAPKEIKGEWLLGIAAVVGVMGIALARSRGGLLAPLARGYRVQSVLLIVLAIPVLLDGPTLLLAWMLLASGLALHGVWNQNRLAFVGAAGVWGLAILCWLDDSMAGMHDTWFSFLGPPISKWVCLGGLLMFSGHFIGACLHRFARARSGGNASSDQAVVTSRASGVGYAVDLLAAVVLATALVRGTPTMFATWWLGIYAWALLALAFAAALPELATVALIVISGTSIKWLTDLLHVRYLVRAYEPSGLVPLGHLFRNNESILGYSLASSMGVMAWCVGRLRERDGRSREKTDSLLAVSFTLTLVFLGVVFSTQIVGTMIVNSVDSTTAALYRNLLLTIVWSACACVWMLTLRQAIATAKLRQTIEQIALGVALLLAGKFVAFDVLGSYVDLRPTLPIVLNLQVLTAAIVGGLVVLTAVFAKTSPWRRLAVYAVAALVLVAGSAEIDRYAVLQTNGPAWIVRQVGWSIYWSLLAVLSLVVGFAARLKGLRYLALILLAVTLLKVVLIDMSGAGTGWRILSFLGLGALLMATSVLYGKFGPKESKPATSSDH